MSDDLSLASVLTFSRKLDDLLERAMLRDDDVPTILDVVLSAIADELHADFAVCFTYDASLELDAFWHERTPLADSFKAELIPALHQSSEVRDTVFADGVRVLAHPLDVDGQWLGTVAVGYRSRAWVEENEGLAVALLDAACEQLDDVLFSAYTARLKQDLFMRLGEALRHRSLAEALRRAVRVLFEGIDMEKFLLVCTSDDSPAATTQLQVYERGVLQVDSMGLTAPVPEQSKLVESAGRLLQDDDRSVLDELRFHGALEETLIDGVVERTVVGKVFASKAGRAFTTHDRDLFAGFASFVRQRIVDFHKEWRTLSSSFSAQHVVRLVREEDYERRFLGPREARVAVVYADITGFTRLSEQVLKSPDSVARLVERWGNDAVDLIWRHGGVFDKMVGDCVIALFGPPFYDQPPTQRLSAAIACARDLRAMTEQLPSTGHLDKLRGERVTVSVGINLAPLFVGLFQPGNNFTGFSSGMNNTARLQGVASGGQILVMEQACAVLPADSDISFGPVAEAKVKNVSAPLRFRPLL